MQFWRMKGIVGLGLAAIMVLTAAHPAAADEGQPLAQVIDGYYVQLHFTAPLAAAPVPVEVVLVDAHGQPVTEAKVAIVEAQLAAPADPHSHSEPAASDPHATEAGHAGHAAETTGSDALAHDESGPHTHDESILFQLAAADRPGTYAGSIIYFQPGAWATHVQFEMEGTVHTAEFVVDIPAPDWGQPVLAGFAGLNAGIVAVAAILKRRLAR